MNKYKYIQEGNVAINIALVNKTNTICNSVFNSLRAELSIGQKLVNVSTDSINKKALSENRGLVEDGNWFVFVSCNYVVVRFKVGTMTKEFTLCVVDSKGYITRMLDDLEQPIYDVEEQVRLVRQAEKLMEDLLKVESKICSFLI